MRLSHLKLIAIKIFRIRYEVNFQNGQECGGAYLKLLSEEKAMNLVSSDCFKMYAVSDGSTCINNLKFFRKTFMIKLHIQ